MNKLIKKIIKIITFYKKPKKIKRYGLKKVNWIWYHIIETTKKD